MARFRRRRRPPVVWLPMLGNGSQSETDTLAFGETGTLLCRPDGQITWDATSLTFDYQIDPVTAQTSGGTLPPTLHDIVSGNAYRLRRVVGKFFTGIQRFTLDEQTEVGGAEVGAGIIVVRCDSNGTPNTDFNYVNPLITESTDDPWVWHRRWLLGFGEANATVETTSPGYNIAKTFPSNNVYYGSVQDGPHIDSKTARVIASDERLFFVVATRQFSFGDGGATLSNFYIGWNIAVRLLATMRTTSGNRRNASR